MPDTHSGGKNVAKQMISDTPNKSAVSTTPSYRSGPEKPTPAVTSISSLPKMHNGGPVLTDGAYQLKAGEHVLTAPEAAKARKHALLASGMKSLAAPQMKSKSTAGQPKAVDAAHKKPEKKVTSDIKVRPEKKEGAQVKQQMAR